MLESARMRVKCEQATRSLWHGESMHRRNEPSLVAKWLKGLMLLPQASIPALGGVEHMTSTKVQY